MARSPRSMKMSKTVEEILSMISEGLKSVEFNHKLQVKNKPDLKKSHGGDRYRSDEKCPTCYMIGSLKNVNNTLDIGFIGSEKEAMLRNIIEIFRTLNRTISIAIVEQMRNDLIPNKTFLENDLKRSIEKIQILNKNIDTIKNEEEEEESNGQVEKLYSCLKEIKETAVNLQTSLNNGGNLEGLASDNKKLYGQINLMDSYANDILFGMEIDEIQIDNQVEAKSEDSNEEMIKDRHIEIVKILAPIIGDYYEMNEHILCDWVLRYTNEDSTLSDLYKHIVENNWIINEIDIKQAETISSTNNSSESDNTLLSTSYDNSSNTSSRSRSSSFSSNNSVSIKDFQKSMDGYEIVINEEKGTQINKVNIASTQDNKNNEVINKGPTIVIIEEENDDDWSNEFNLPNLTI